jgi:hypothetical protein
MAKLIINNWSDNAGWVDESHWPVKAYYYRLSLCTELKSTELKRAAKALRNKEVSEIENVNPDEAGAIINTLESIGANVSIAP